MVATPWEAKVHWDAPTDTPAPGGVAKKREFFANPGHLGKGGTYFVL